MVDGGCHSAEALVPRAARLKMGAADDVERLWCALSEKLAIK